MLIMRSYKGNYGRGWIEFMLPVVQIEKRLPVLYEYRLVRIINRVFMILVNWRNNLHERIVRKFRNQGEYGV